MFFCCYCCLLFSLASFEEHCYGQRLGESFFWSVGWTVVPQRPMSICLTLPCTPEVVCLPIVMGPHFRLSILSPFLLVYRVRGSVICYFPSNANIRNNTKIVELYQGNKSWRIEYEKYLHSETLVHSKGCGRWLMSCRRVISSNSHCLLPYVEYIRCFTFCQN